jgi:hypothetical protein
MVKKDCVRGLALYVCTVVDLRDGSRGTCPLLILLTSESILYTLCWARFAKPSEHSVMTFMRCGNTFEMRFKLLDQSVPAIHCLLQLQQYNIVVARLTILPTDHGESGRLCAICLGQPQGTVDPSTMPRNACRECRYFPTPHRRACPPT